MGEGVAEETVDELVRREIPAAPKPDKRRQNLMKKPQKAAEDSDENAVSDNGESEVVNEVIEQAKEVQRAVEKVYFLSVLKRFGLAFGGILLFLGVISAVLFFLLFFHVFSTGLPKNIELVIEIGLGMLATIHILAGLTLLAG